MASEGRELVLGDWASPCTSFPCVFSEPVGDLLPLAAEFCCGAGAPWLPLPPLGLPCVFSSPLLGPLFVGIALAAAGLRVLARRGAIFFVLDRLARLLLLLFFRLLHRLIFVGFFSLGRFAAAGAGVHVVLVAALLIVATLLVWFARLLLIAVGFVLRLFLSVSFALPSDFWFSLPGCWVESSRGLVCDDFPSLIFGCGVLRVVPRLLLIGAGLLVCPGLAVGLLLLN